MLLLRPLGRQPSRGYRFYLGSVGVFGAAGPFLEGWAPATAWPRPAARTP